VFGNRVQVGTEDLKEISENYSDILANEMRTRRHRGSDGAYDGIEITEIKPGSVAERHGLKGGDVIKSINGHAVNSVSEAVSYVKNNAGIHEGAWEVVIENLGSERTVYIDPP
jgi:S1-C subfamily serine protease